MTLGCLPPTCSGLFGFDASITPSSSTLAYVSMCNIGSINNVFAVMLAVHSLVVLDTVPVKNTSELMAPFVQAFLDKSCLFNVPPDARSYVSSTVAAQC